MTYRALVTDYDGTLASDGIVAASTIDALTRLRKAGFALLMVTGRELPSLFATFSRTDLFHCIVAENGAVLYTPASRDVTILGTPPPPALLTRLADDGVPISVGHSIVATTRPYEFQMLAALRDLGLEWHVVFNKSAVMALPADVNKATGLAHALVTLRLLPEAVVGIGDAENDQAFLRLCGLAVAVANALPAVKEGADLITRDPRGAGVEELVIRLLEGDLDPVEPLAANHVQALRETIRDSGTLGDSS